MALSKAGLVQIGTGVAADRSIIFDGNAQDFHIGIDDSADDLTIGLGTALGTTSHIVIDEAGCVTKPLQPAFLATKSGAQSNVAINATTTIVFDTEVFDNNADFASNTFTAPVTGRYQFNALINWNGWDTDYVYVWHKFTVSNRTVYANLAGGNQVTADGYLFASSSVLVDMDANDTCKFEVEFPNEGAAQADVQQSSWFSGYLVA